MRWKDPSERHLVSLMLGYQVVIEYMAGPELNPDNQEEEAKGQLEARTGLFWIQGISNAGVEVSRTEEPKDEVFLPWGAILAVYGRSRAELERDVREVIEADRQDLLSRLRDPQLGDTNLESESNDYLYHYPDDAEVQRGLDRLRRRS